MSELSSIEDVKHYVLSKVAPLAAARLEVAGALGLVLAEAVIAEESIPAFANSAMDGFALRAADTLGAPIDLEVVGETMAGGMPPSISEGEALRIMTGAPIPLGADAVCPLEAVQSVRQAVHIDCPVTIGANIRQPGEDVRQGEMVFDVGERLGAAHLGVLASLGVPAVLVHRRPRVGVLSSGDELSASAGSLEASQIRDANRPALIALVEGSGCIAVDLGIVGDDEHLFKKTIDDSFDRCDVLITSGGVSFGDRDIARGAILALAEEDDARAFEVAMRPAKPFTFGVIGPERIPIFGLPGNPVSALVAFEVFVRPALLRLGGNDTIERPEFRAILDEEVVRRPDGKVHYVRSIVTVDRDGNLHVRSAGGQNPHMLRIMALANTLAIIPDGTGARRGDEVRVIVTDPDRLAETH